MADSWEDDWEADTLVAGVNINAVDDSKFAGEDQDTGDWEEDVPKSQPRKAPTESKYASKDREYAAKAGVVEAAGESKAAQQAAQERADLVAAQELFGTAAEASKLDTMIPKSNTEFDEYAQLLVAKYVTPHKNAKQWKFFVKSLVRQACESLNKDELKEVEAAVATVRSDKVKADLAAAKALKTGGKKNLKMESDDITAAMDYRGAGSKANADDDFDFM